jgi:Cu(I)/Ag(I) efflux system membrane fusion protein
MSAKTIVTVLLVATLAGAAGWWLGRSGASHSTEAGGRKVLYYQSAMHPWIKSDKPGKCTICGMDLTPVYEGEQGVSTAADIITLSSNAISVVGVQTEKVTKGGLTRSLRVAGMIDDNDSRHQVMSAYVDGRLDELFVNYVGAEVKAGEPLALIYSPMLLAAEREYVALARSQSPNENPEQARLLAAATLRLKQYGLSTNQIAALVNKSPDDIHSEILAPMSGTVTVREVYEGQTVMSGEKLFELSDFSTMWFQFDAYERDLSWLRVGQMVAVSAASVPGKVFTAPIVFIDPNLNETTRSAKVRVELANPLVEVNGRTQRELLHRVYAEGVVNVETPSVLTVPRTAVLSPDGQPRVYVDKAGAYEQRKVKLGRSGDNAWEILEGVEEGESVVTHGSLLIDAQAQLNASTSGASNHQHANQSEKAILPELSATQNQAAQELFAAVGKLSSALAADDLAAFNQSTESLHPLLPRFKAAFAGQADWQALATKIESGGHIAKADDLIAARAAFHTLSMAVVELARAVRAQSTNFAGVKVYQCPMTKSAFPNAPRSAMWLQTEGEIRNPYFGASMLDCGTEVKP